MSVTINHQTNDISATSGTMTIDGNASGANNFLSSGQTVTSAGGLTVAHGLGAQPTLIWAYIECTTAEFGYSVGDKLWESYTSRDTSANRSQGYAIVADATNLVVRFADYTQPLAGVNKATGAAVYFTNANWDLYLGAQA